MITPEIEADVLRIYNANPKRFSPFKASKQVGCSLSEVITIIKKHENSFADGSEHNEGKGRPDLQGFIIASRRVNSGGWDNTDPGIVEARKRFCNGTHDMATHRDGAWLHLCSIPLARKRRPRPNYFSTGAAG